jgi:hypothetical protein
LSAADEHWANRGQCHGEIAERITLREDETAAAPAVESVGIEAIDRPALRVITVTEFEEKPSCRARLVLPLRAVAPLSSDSCASSGEAA